MTVVGGNRQVVLLLVAVFLVLAFWFAHDELATTVSSTTHGLYLCA